jgi:hypothetical protein
MRKKDVFLLAPHERVAILYFKVHKQPQKYSKQSTGVPAIHADSIYPWRRYDRHGDML